MVLLCGERSKWIRWSHPEAADDLVMSRITLRLRPDHIQCWGERYVLQRQMMNDVSTIYAARIGYLAMAFELIR
jgi:hypothetical protein